jgi:hypothetical protein
MQKTVATWLAIVSAIATGAARIQSLDEAKANSERWIAELHTQTKELQDKVEALERDRVLLERVHAIEVRLSQMESARRR